MNNEELHKLHNEELNILKLVVRFCDENHIQYFLTAGSLLGAVRHKGFIPWDDDLDISMPRDDYERFLSIAANKLDKCLYLHCNNTDTEYWLPFAKVRMNDTEFVEPTIEKIQTHKGIFIDIFPLDNAKKQKGFFQYLQAKTAKAQEVY